MNDPRPSLKASLQFLTLVAGSLATAISARAAVPVIAFASPTNGQQIVTLSGITGNFQTTGTIQKVTFSIYNQSLGQWWNGSSYQEAATNLPATVSGTNWSPSAGTVLPAVCCGQACQLGASATDTAADTGNTTITVYAESVPPVVTFAPLANGQTVSNLSAIGGSATDSFTTVASVVFTIQELDINGGPGRWWNGTNFQSASVPLAATISAGHWLPAGGLALPALNSGQSYALTATAVDSVSNSATATITVTDAMTVLAWDPGQTPGGTVVLPNPNTNGGNYWFEIIPQSPVVGVWRTALNVPVGQAGVYLNQRSPPNIYSANFASAHTGSNGFVVDASQFNPGQAWYILVNASTNAHWTLVTGDVFVYNLGSLATDSSSSTNASIGAESMIFYQTTIPSTTAAWQLWINGVPNQLYVKKSAAPDPVSYDLTQAGQMLVVPPYLAGGTYNGSYFIGIAGAPSTPVKLDSRQQPIIALPFSSVTNLVVTTTNFPYVTYQVQVPVQQIAWQLNLTPTSGNPAIAVRRATVPNEFRNDAYSEVPANVGASVSLVPPPANSGAGTPGLSDGTWYVTVYSTAPYTCAFQNANPVITDVDYEFIVTNDAPSRAGWRYYTVTDIDGQLGTLGWQLLLANQAPGSEIALRRNAVPGQWNFRNDDDNYYNSSLGYVDLSSTYGLLQQPGHQADIWYIGVYTPAQALGNFVLTGSQLTGQPLSFNGTGSSVSVTNSFPGEWQFFEIDVPADTNLLGWDVRLVNVTAGAPQMVVSRDTLPAGLSTGVGWVPSYYYPFDATNWPSGLEWLAGNDWSHCGGGPLLEMGQGNPLQAGTYYIGVQDPNNTNSFTLQSRGIGSGYTIPVHSLGFAGSVTNLALPVGQADYYQLVVPGNAPDWKLHLNLAAGDAVMEVQQGYLPNSSVFGGLSSYGGVQTGQGGQLMEKPGVEQWALLPYYNETTNLLPGTYYILVASQGQNLTNNCEGAGTASYTLSSTNEPAIPLPDTLAYGNDLLFTNSQAGGEMKFYQFNVPAGIASIEVTLENVTGDPVMLLDNGTNLVGTGNNGVYSYGNYGGVSPQWINTSLITVANPATNYSLSVYGSVDASGIYADASYVVRVRAIPPPLLTFDNGTLSVTNQPPGVWQFFQVNVPADTNLLGWDIRLINVTAGSPELVVCRDTLPVGLYTSVGWVPSYYYPYDSTNWPDGLQWLAGEDWTDCGGGPMLEMGLNNPLQAGTYFIGVQDPNNTNSFTLRSRGIGLTNYTIPVRSLGTTGSATNLALPVGEADYYQVVIPDNAPDWKLHLNLAAGDAVMEVQQNYLPNPDVPGNVYSYGGVISGQGGQLMDKAGDEQWALLPYYNNGPINLLPGTYFVLVASQGQNLINNCEGTGTASYILSSTNEPPIQLPDHLTYGNDLLFTNAQAGGETKFYQFNVPAGTASIEVTLENVTGRPVMKLAAGTALVSPCPDAFGNTGGSSSDSYGNYGGVNPQWINASLITVANPTTNYSLSVYGSITNSGVYADASYVLRVRAVPPPVVAFDGGTFSVTNQPPGVWQFFEITVPTDTNLLGWDLRLMNVTAGNPQMVVSRDTLPVGLYTSVGWVPSYYYPYDSTNWPGGLQWLAGEDWTRCGGGPMLEMGLDNPLQAGTYFIGVQDPNNANSFTLQSRGIGLTNYTIPVRSLGITGSATNLALPVGEADYYRVVVPDNASDWKLHLNLSAGDTVMEVQQDYLPNSEVPGLTYSYGGVISGQGGQLMEKAGDEQWALLPYYNNEPTNLLPGTYYLLVASQGQNLINNCEGTGTASYTLSSTNEPVIQLPSTLTYDHDLLFTNRQAGGETKFYQFNVPPGTAVLEVALEDVVGNPTMKLATGTALVSPSPDIYGNTGGSSPDSYGNYGGINPQWKNASLITLPNPTNSYSLSVYGSIIAGSSDYADASYTLDVHAYNPPPLSFSPELDTATVTNVVSGILADSQHDYYQVTVPASVNGAPVLGWKLDLTALAGSPSIRVRPNLPPDNTCDTTTFGSPAVTIAPPYLTPGIWYVDVLGTGSTTYSLTSSVITTNSLAHAVWVMPAFGQTNSAPGLALPFIGDSGVDTNGNPLPGDQGIDLKQGEYDYYAVLVPTNNAGVLRTELQAISGNPNLYIRVGAAPTLDHYAQGSCDGGDRLVDRQLTGGTTEYGNWVPLNGRFETQLTNGLWMLAVQANGDANARYRLQVSCGNSVTNGLVQDLALGDGSDTNQNLDGGDWRYYRVQIPDPAPANWTVTWSRSLGSARMFVRDTVPPGDGDYSSYNSPNSYANSSYNPTLGSTDLQTWNSDDKNEGPYPRFDNPGTAILTTPPLRPGAVYYLGFWSPVDTTFSVSSSTNGGSVLVTNSLAFIGGSITNIIPGHGSLLYRLSVPSSGTRILLNASNSTDIGFSLEQGTIALAGGPAQWISYLYNYSYYGYEANASLNEFLDTPNNWPWQPGYAYYLIVTNTAPAAENFSVTMGLPVDLSPVAFLAPMQVNSTQPNPAIQVIWEVVNHGPATVSGNWYDAIWFSTNGVLDASSIDLANFGEFSPTLPPGATYWQTNNVTLPMSSSGNYTLFVQVDAENNLYETSITDKVSPPVNGSFILTPPQLLLSGAGFSAPGQFQLAFYGEIGQTYTLQASTNLVNWVSFPAFMCTSSPFYINDPSSANYPRRFYRVVGQ